MKAVSTSEMRELDRRTITEFGIPGAELMDRAGEGVARAVKRMAMLSGLGACPVRLCAGHGNNGGDAFVAARYLREWGFPVSVELAGVAAKLSGDALLHFQRLLSGGVAVREAPAEADWTDLPDRGGHSYGIVVDGMLGTGISGAPSGTVAAAIRHINWLGNRNLIVAIDVPSGLDSDTGLVAGDAVKADLTVTMGLPKTGLLEPAAIDYVGNLEVVDIGIPGGLSADVRANLRLIAAEDVAALLPRRARGSHKGTYGHVLLIGGAAGYTGAIAIAAKAAVRSGVGLVTVLAPRSIAATVAGLVPEAMVHGMLETETGSLAGNCRERWGQDTSKFDAVLIGPGMTTHVQSRDLLERVLNETRGTVVMDADALNVLGRRPERIRQRAAPTVATPHPGELARLLSQTADAIQADRFGSARRMAELSGAVAVLKGAGTIVASKDLPLHVNMTGNPGMAKGGMGDALGGLIAGFCAQGMMAFDAACAGVYLHGLAGDRSALRLGQTALAATDVVEELPRAFRDVIPR